MTVRAKNARYVKCVETKIVYGSVTEAAEDAGVSRSAIRQSIRLGCRAGGAHWAYAFKPGATIADIWR